MPSWPTEMKVLMIVQENCEKSLAKQKKVLCAIPKIWLQFFVQYFLAKHNFYTKSSQTPLNFFFEQIWVSWNRLSVLKLIFKATELNLAKFYLCHKPVFFKLASNAKLLTRSHSSWSETLLIEIVSLFLDKADYFCCFHTL